MLQSFIMFSKNLRAFPKGRKRTDFIDITEQKRFFMIHTTFQYRIEKLLS